MSARFSFSYLCCCYVFLLIVVSLLHLCLSNRSFDDDVLCIGSERQALLRFKHDLIDEAGRLASWDYAEESNCCKWVGIGCDNITGHVHRIHLPALNGHCNNNEITYKEYEDVSKQRLRGKLSSSLLHLKQLRHLDLSCNDFGGIKIPKFIGSLSSLRYLNLSYSSFDGMIPPQLGNLSKLHVLCLSSFQRLYETTSMMNMQWLTNLHSLQHLDLSGVDLSKSINWLHVINTVPSLVQLRLSRTFLTYIHPHVASVNLTSLSLLDLSYNNFSSSFPQWIFSITSLVSLDLSDCSFHGLIPGSIYTFRNLTSLESVNVRGNSFMNSSLVLKDLSSVGSKIISLDISSCGISSSVLDSLQNLTSLRSLDLSLNQLSNALPKSLGCDLRDLDLSRNDFSNISLTSLLESVFKCKSSHLESLSLSFSKLSGTIADSIGRLSFLRSLDLSNNFFAGSLHDLLCSNGVKETKALNLGNNHFSDLIPECWDKWLSLNILNLENNNFSGGIPTTLGFLSQLRSLNMRGNKLSGRLPSSLMNLTNLVILQLGRNKLVGGIPSLFGTKLSFLRFLNLRSNNFDGNIPTELCYLKHIQILDLAQNNMSGNIPICFNNFSDFTGNKVFFRTTGKGVMGSDSLIIKGRGDPYRTFLGPVMLDLSSNNLVGHIPSELTSLKALQALNLSRNRLTGRIPEKIGEVKALISLDLSMNMLSGELPMGLSSLNFLSSFNVSYNNLTGRVPSGIQLQSFDESSFFGNKLCGPPLTKRC